MLIFRGFFEALIVLACLGFQCVVIGVGLAGYLLVSSIMAPAPEGDE